MSLSVCVRWTAFENMIDDTSSVQERLAYRDERRTNYISGQGQETSVTHVTTEAILSPPHEWRPEAAPQVSHIG